MWLVRKRNENHDFYYLVLDLISFLNSSFEFLIEFELFWSDFL